MATRVQEPAERTSRRAGEEGQASGHSGRLLLRMPQSLHRELADAAARDGVSLNQFITNALADTVRWKRSDKAVEGSRDPAGERERGSRRRDPLMLALVVNLVVVLAAAAVAIGLLIAAW